MTKTQDVTVVKVNMNCAQCHQNRMNNPIGGPPQHPTGIASPLPGNLPNIIGKPGGNLPNIIAKPGGNLPKVIADPARPWPKGIPQGTGVGWGNPVGGPAIVRPPFINIFMPPGLNLDNGVAPPPSSPPQTAIVKKPQPPIADYLLGDLGKPRGD